MAVSAELQVVISAVSDVQAAFKDVLKQMDNLGKAAVQAQSNFNAIAGANAPLQQVAANAANAGQAVASTGQVVQNFGVQARNAAANANTFGKSLGGVNDVASSLKEGLDKLVRGIQLVTGGFLAFKAVAIVKDILDTGARVETLNIALRVVGQNAGLTQGRIVDLTNSVKRLGITSAAAAQSLVLLIQNKIPVDFAEPLARAAQNLAVITGQNSSVTLQKLITNITQLDTVGLRFMGIMIDKEKVLAEAAARAGVALDETAQKTAFATAVLEKAADIQGVYTASLDAAGKALTSMPRYIEEFKNSLSTGLQPAYTAPIQGTNELLGALTELVQTVSGTAPLYDEHGKRIQSTTKQYSALADLIKKFFAALVSGVEFLKKHAEAIAVVTEAVIAMGAAYLAFIGTLSLVRNAMIAFETVKIALDLTSSISGISRFINVLELLFPVLVRARLALQGFISTLRTGGVTALRFAGVVGAIIAAAITLYEVYQRLTEGSKKVVVGDEEQTAALNRYKAQVLATSSAIQARIKLSTELKNAQAREAAAKPGEDAEKAAARTSEVQGELDAMTRKVELSQKEVEKLKTTLEGMALDPKIFESLNEFEAQQAKATGLALQQQRAVQKADTAFRELELTTAAITKQSPEFAKQFGTMQTAVASLSDELTGTGGKAIALIPKLQALSTSVKTPKDLEDFNKLQSDALAGIGRLYARGELSIAQFIELENRIKSVYIVAEDSAAKYAKSQALGGDPGQQIRESIDRATIAAQASRQQRAISDRRLALEVETSNIQAAYTERKISFDDLMAHEEKRIKEETQLEKESIQVQIDEQKRLRSLLTLPSQADERLTIDEHIKDLLSQQNDLIEKQKIKENQLHEQRTNHARQEALAIERLEALEEGFRAEIGRATNEEEFQLKSLEKRYDLLISKQKEFIQARQPGPAGKKAAKDFEELALQAKAAEIERVRLAADQRRQAILNQTNKIHAQLLAQTDDEAAAVAEINLKYDQQNDALAKQQTGQTEAVRIAISRAIQENNILRAIELQNTALDVSLKKIERVNALNAARRARQESQIDLAVARGEITSVAALQARNKLIEEEIADQQKIQDAIVDKIYAEKRAFDIKQESVELTKEEYETHARLMEDYRARLDQADASINRLKAQVQSVGDAWRIGFTQDMASAFNDVLERGTRFADAMADLAKKLKFRILETMTQDMAENVVHVFDKVAGSLFGTDSLFGGLGDLLFPKQRGTDKSHPMYTEEVGKDKDGSPLDKALKPVKDTMGVFWDNLKDGFGKAAEWGKDFFGKMGTGFMDIFDKVKGFLGTIAGGAGDFITGAFKMVSGFLGLAEGGPVPGAGTGDTVPAMLTPGEYVMPKRQTAMFYPILTAMRSGSITSNLQLVAESLPNLKRSSPYLYPVQRLAEGGMVRAVDMGKKAKEQQAPTVVLAINPESINMTLRDWMEGELGRIAANR